MGQAKLKAVRKIEKEARKGERRIQALKVEGQLVAYDEHGRAKQDGSGSIEPFFIMEADIPAEVIAIIRDRFPKLDFVTIDPKANQGEDDAPKSKLSD